MVKGLNNQIPSFVHPSLFSHFKKVQKEIEV